MRPWTPPDPSTSPLRLPLPCYLPHIHQKHPLPPCFLLQPSHGGRTPPSSPNPPYLVGVCRRTAGGRRQRASPLPRPPLPHRRPRRTPFPSIFFLYLIFTKHFKDELSPIYSNAALRQQATPCSCSTRCRFPSCE
uniref:Uncharacterized protein n=1 Tax=Setaria viridis TaxID=4556 RepID=A0A4U6UBQ4_SETVI|nr:hypothetical protein SEVIR_7G327750v2 [Setaria viridis]